MQNEGTNIPILKGREFADRVRQICAELPEVRPIENLQYRRILIPGMIGGEVQFTLLAFIGHALRMRGAEVTALCCDEFLPACTLRKANHKESACKRWCFKNIGSFLEAARIPYRWYSEFISQKEKEQFIREASNVSAKELEKYVFEEIPLGMHVRRSVESYFKVGRFNPKDAEMLAKGREFLASGMCLVHIGNRFIDAYGIEKLFMEDGRKIDWGVMREVARSRGIPVDYFPGSTRGRAYLAKHECGAEESDPIPLWDKWKNTPLNEAQTKQLDMYFRERVSKPFEDQNWEYLNPLNDVAEIRRRLDIPDNVGKVFSMYPNVSYDAGVTTTNPTYYTAAEWVVETIRYFVEHPEHHLVIKIHPGEGYYGVQDPTDRYIQEHVAELSANIHVLSHDTHLTAFDVIKASDVILVYTSTVGIEAAYLGKPVINAGGGWHAGRGFSTDVQTPEAYFQALKEACLGRFQVKSDQELGRRYAYAAFFRSALPINFYTAMIPDLKEIHLTSLYDLVPGRDRSLDVICKGILSDGVFALDD